MNTIGFVSAASDNRLTELMRLESELRSLLTKVMEMKLEELKK